MATEGTRGAVTMEEVRAELLSLTEEILHERLSAAAYRVGVLVGRLESDAAGEAAAGGTGEAVEVDVGVRVVCGAGP